MEGSQYQGLNFTTHAQRLCADISARLPEFAHIDMGRVAVRYCQTRRAGMSGVHATLTPMRFEGGRREQERRGRRWAVQQILDPAGREMLYLLSFYLPRFLEQPLGEKLATVCHELWHISPAFDGDIRRHEGRCYAHGPSEKEFHEHSRGMAQRWLALEPDPALYEFLRFGFRELKARHGGVYGTRLPTPRLIPAR